MPARHEPIYAGRKEVVRLFARVSIFKGEPGNAEGPLKVVREKILPAARELEGFAGMLALADPSTGKSMGITFWQTEEALKASEQAADRMRNESAGETGDQVAGVERYEVMLDERG